MKSQHQKIDEDHLAFRVGYCGTSFKGFQRQAHANSIQQYLEAALSILLRQKTRIQFSSRTDSGVHAYDQVVVIPNGYSLFERLVPGVQRRFLISLNSLLQEKVVAWQMLRLKGSFHIKKDILWKEYHYKILQGVGSDPLAAQTYWAIRSSLNFAAIARELAPLKGEYDFSGFASKKNNSNEKVDNRRTILETSIVVKNHPHLKSLKHIEFRFRGDGFLYRMVRNMVGVLVAVGRGRSISVNDILHGKKRPSEAVSAPAQGLVLAKTKIPSRAIVKILGIGFLSLLFSFTGWATEDSFSGSASVSVHQRFFDDPKLGHVNGFSEWGALEFRSTFGICDLPYGFEPTVGFAFIKNSASLYALDDSGAYILDSNGQRIRSDIDWLEYQFYSASAGVRWKAWDPDFFMLIPYGEVLQDFRYGRVRKRTFSVNQPKLNTGFDIGFEVAGGLLISFMADDALQSNMRMEWGVKDFALLTTVRYLSGGVYRKGLGLVESTGGWDFGAGLFLDW